MRGAEISDACIVDEDFDGAQGLRGFLHQRRNIARPRDVRGNSQHLACFALQFMRGAFEFFRVARAHAEMRSQTAQTFRDGEPDAAACPSDQCDFAFERFSCHHRSSDEATIRPDSSSYHQYSGGRGEPSELRAKAYAGNSTCLRETLSL